MNPLIVIASRTHDSVAAASPLCCVREREREDKQAGRGETPALPCLCLLVGPPSLPLTTVRPSLFTRSLAVGGGRRGAPVRRPSAAPAPLFLSLRESSRARPSLSLPRLSPRSIGPQERGGGWWWTTDPICACAPLHHHAPKTLTHAPKQTRTHSRTACVRRFWRRLYRRTRQASMPVVRYAPALPSVRPVHVGSSLGGRRRGGVHEARIMKWEGRRGEGTDDDGGERERECGWQGFGFHWPSRPVLAVVGLLARRAGSL